MATWGCGWVTISEKMSDKKLPYKSGCIEGKPCKCIGIGEKILTEEQHRALNKPMNQGIRRNGRQK